MRVAKVIITGILLSRVSASARDFSGRVVGIADGDTLSVMHDGHAVKVRLYGIDAPEKGQAFGNRSKQFVSALAFEKEVRVEVKGRDRYGRTIADLMVLPRSTVGDLSSTPSCKSTCSRF